MFTQSDYDKVLDYFFQKRKFPTPNRKFFESVMSTRAQEEDFYFSTPWTVSWQVTSPCNLRCKHCFFEGNQDKYKPDNDLDTATVLSLAQDLNNVFSAVSLSITGGEVMMRKDIFDLLKEVKRNNMTVALQTNGTLIDEKKAELLASILNKETDFVQISLDGSSKNVYEKIRGENTFEKAINGIKLLIKNGFNLTVNATAMSENLDDLNDLYDFCCDLGIKKLSVSRFVTCYDEQKYLECDFSDLIKPFSQIIEKCDENPNKTFFEMNFRFYDFVSTEQLRVYADEYLKKNPKEKSVCENISCHRHNTLYINPKGEMYLCFACENKEGMLGVYPQNSLSEIWENRKNNLFFQPRLSKNSLCKKCKYFAYCQSGCMGSAYSAYKNICAPDGLCVYAKNL